VLLSRAARPHAEKRPLPPPPKRATAQEGAHRAHLQPKRFALASALGLNRHAIRRDQQLHQEGMEARKMTRLPGMAAAALAAASLIFGISAGISAESKKPKEIVVVGSKKAPAKASKVESLSIKQKATESRGGKGYKLENAWPKM
jgi:hypothetical protein